MVKLSPKALRIVKVASRDFPLAAAECGAVLEIVEHWRSSFEPPAPSGLREKVEIPDDVAAAFLALIDTVTGDPSNFEVTEEWDQNDFAFLGSIGASIRAELRPLVSAGR